MPVLENCEPKRVFHYFEEICKIPHGSRNTKQISDFLVEFAKDHGFRYVQDELNNVVIYKPGTSGYENSPTVIIQGHMDMVCEKRPDVDHDFTKDGLNISVKMVISQPTEQRLAVMMVLQLLMALPFLTVQIFHTLLLKYCSRLMRRLVFLVQSVWTAAC